MEIARALVQVWLGLLAVTSLGCGPPFTNASAGEGQAGAAGANRPTHTTGAGGSAGAQAPCAAPCHALDDCHAGLCDEASGTCVQVAASDGAPCGASDACGPAGTCSAGACVKGPPVDCSALDDVCNRGRCDPQAGCVKRPANEGGACDDGLFCTVDDACKEGTCTGAPNTCGVTDPCFTTTCDEAQRSCVSAAGNDGAACACADRCFVGTTCSAGTCGDPKFVISQCVGGDACCPAGCTKANDSDCP